MAVNYELFKLVDKETDKWVGTGRVVSVREPTDIPGGSTRRPTKGQVHAAHTIRKLDDSKKWRRTSKKPAHGPAVVRRKTPDKSAE